MNPTIGGDGKQKHDGRNVKRIREILQVKQSALATELGPDWNQKKVSQLEDKETIDDTLLEEIAGALKVPVEAIKNFDEEATVYNIQYNQDGANNGSGTIGNSLNYHYCTFNPIDKIVELYDALVKSEKEKNELLQRMLDGKK